VRRWDQPLAALAWLEDQSRSLSAGRWIGYLSYDLGRLFEDLPSVATDDLGLPLFAFALLDGDAAETSSSPPGTRNYGANLPASRGSAGGSPSQKDASCSREIAGSKKNIGDSNHPTHSTLAREQYLEAVRRVIDYIRAGDVFQVNLSQRFTVFLPQPASAVYARLLSTSPAWYGAYLNFGDYALICNSPELFLSVAPDPPTGRRRAITCPIKGTRPRLPGMDRELRDSVKDQAELNMIVDLERNDLGRVCEIGTVKVTEPRVIESHPTVYHGAATIEGMLRDDVGLVDLLRATFPGGSVTGAPKIRAMQIIDELEPVRRGPYCGAIGYLAPGGRIELNVAIRTMIVKDGLVHIPVGGGIVADSDPAAEYEETLVKARAMFAALGMNT